MISFILVLLFWKFKHIHCIAPYMQLNDGNYIPIVAFGTGRSSGSPLDVIYQSVYWAIESGYRHIDTATYYNDEEQIGQAIADAVRDGLVNREEMFVTTKLMNNKHAKDQVIPSIKESLRNLGLDYVDLYLIHTPIATKDDGSPDDIDYLETWQGMEEAKLSGLTRSIGVSSFNVTQIHRLYSFARIKPAVNQIEVNPTMTEELLVEYCQNLGIAVMGYSPFGFMVSRNINNDIPPKYDDPILVQIAEKYGKSTAQVVLRYLIDRGVIPIPMSTNRNRIAENIDIFDFQFTPEEISTINSFNRNIRVFDREKYRNYPNFPY